MKLYFAYGANMNLNSMGFRCPNAIKVGRAVLPGYKLVFRRVADVIESPDDFVQGALWKITEDCERSLDRFEGFPRLYEKTEVEVNVGGKMKKAMIYVMVDKSSESAPTPSYFSTILQGYLDFGWSRNDGFTLYETAYKRKLTDEEKRSCKSR